MRRVKVFVTGATGVLGRATVPELIAAGHDVVAPGRTPEKRALLRQAGAEAIECDVFDFAQLAQAAAPCEAFVNLATHIPPPDKALFKSAWRENDRIRTELSALAARVAQEDVREVLLRVLVQESIVMNYADRGDQWIDEQTSIQTTRPTASAVKAEENALGAARAGVRAVVLRFGVITARGSVHDEYALAMAGRGIAPLLGSADAYLSQISVEDAARAVVVALDAPTGIYNVTEDQPRTRGEIAAQLAAVAERENLRIFPGRLAPLLGRKRVGALARSQRVSNAKFKQATGWSPR
jgi:nucleoside-diphosphate-sugar epimerase